MCAYILSELKCKNMHEYILNYILLNKFRVRLNLFRIRNEFRINLFMITVYFFLTDACTGMLV